MIRDFFLNFIRLHILFHASHEPIFGLDMIRELERHGYNLSPGTLYPILHNLESNRYLTSYREIVNGKIRKYYRTTSPGKAILEESILKIDELLAEIRHT